MVSLRVSKSVHREGQEKSPRESMAARGRRRQGLGVSDSGTFHDRVNTVCRNILKRLDGAVRPADLHGFHFFGGAKGAGDAELLLREGTSSAPGFAELLHACPASV